MRSPSSSNDVEADASEPRWSDDRALASRCVAGDRAATRELYEREKRRVHARLYRIFGSNRAIDDVIQEVFLQIFRSLEGYRAESSLATWIDRCTVRVAFEHLAKGRRRGADLELVHDVASRAPSAERTAIARDATRRLYVALDTIDHTQRVAFVLHAIEGHAVAEVARMMDASVVATKTRIFRARHRLDDLAKNDPVLAEFLEGDDA